MRNHLSVSNDALDNIDSEITRVINVLSAGRDQTLVDLKNHNCAANVICLKIQNDLESLDVNVPFTEVHIII